MAESIGVVAPSNMSESSSPLAVNLSKILNPALYRRCLGFQFPWAPEAADIAFAAKFYFEGVPSAVESTHKACFNSALKPLSTLAPRNIIPDVTRYIPNPSSPEFYPQTLGLILLLDQAPRNLFEGVNARYTSGFFDLICLKLVKGLLNAGVYPESTERWIQEGMGFEDAILRQIWLYAPLVHSEDLEAHAYSAKGIERMRVETEKYYGERDPARDSKEEDAKDVLLFYKLVTQGPPLRNTDFFFWAFRVIDSHTTILKKFGRFPEKNFVLGRDFTPDEEQYMKDNGGFRGVKLSKEEIERLKRQNWNGTWDLLTDDHPRGGSVHSLETQR